MDTKCRRTNKTTVPRVLAFWCAVLLNPIVTFALLDEVRPFRSFHNRIYLFLFLCFAFAGCLIFLFSRTGRTADADMVVLGETGRLPTDVLIFFLFAPVVSFFYIGYLLCDPYTTMVDLACLATPCLAVMLTAALALIRKWRAGRLFSDSLLSLVFKYTKKGISSLLHTVNDLFTGEPLLSRLLHTERRRFFRVLWICTVSFCALAVFDLFFDSSEIFGISYLYLFPIFLVLCLCRSAWLDSRDLLALKAQLVQAADGKDAPVCVEANNDLYEISQIIACLGTHLQESLDSQMKSERMKLDLITNVSHDLKTPLTSIIGYLDLLEKQELAPETRDYVMILRRKSERLALTVQDLFTLAKSTSGSEVLDIKPLDLVMAVRQTLGDLSDVLRHAAIPVKASMPERAIVQADSATLYRVLQNIFDNALRYAMPGTRIYLDVQDCSETVILTLSNTAAYEMTFTPDEILERFVRGDASRTTQGSGLGLSIARSFMQNFGGDLSVEIHGDVFSVVLTFSATELSSRDENSSILSSAPEVFDGMIPETEIPCDTEDPEDDDFPSDLPPEELSAEETSSDDPFGEVLSDRSH